MASPETFIDAGVSEREAEVLELVAQRATNAEIAARLFVSVRTVESHVSSLLRKLDVRDRRGLAELANRGRRTGGAAHDIGPGPGADTGAGARPGGRAAPAASDRPARALPVPLTSFVGRAAEVAQLTEAVETHRLVTATGPGGVGKTRLAAAVAASLASSRRDGAWFVDLVPVGDDALIATAVANTLGLGETHSRTVEDAVVAHLADREALIVLDNCEHVVGGAGVFVERLLGQCPGVTVLATSQARLMLPFEWVFPVPGLSLPDTDGDAHGGGDAVALFVERARQAGVVDLTGDDLDRIGDICRRLDGSALAIELAAARMPSLGVDGIERGLSERFRLLAGGSRVDERHESLRSTIDWSYGLLSPADRALLRRLAVFAAPFTAEAAIEVAGFAPLEAAAVPDGLAHLVEHSLLIASPGAPTRYRALETVRQYGAEQMAAAGADPAGDGPEATEADDARRRHLAWATRAIADLDGRADLPVPLTLEQSDELAEWRRDVDRVADDARAALKWALHRPDLRAAAFDLAGLLAATCFARGLLGESQHRYEQAAEVAPDTAVAIDMLMGAGGAAASRQAGNDALALWRRAADTAAEAGDRGTAAVAVARSAELIQRASGIITDKPPQGTHEALIAEARDLAPGDPVAETAILTAQTFQLDEVDPAAAAAARRAVEAAREIGDPLLESAALDALSVVHLGLGDVPTALESVQRRIELVSQVRPSAYTAFEIADAYNMMTEIALVAGDFTAARGYADTLARLPFHSLEGHLSTSRRMRVEAMAGELDRVLDDAERFRRGWERAGRPANTSLASGAYAAAMAHGLRGDDEARAEWLTIADDLGLRWKLQAGCHTVFGSVFDAIVALHRGDAQGAFDGLDEDPADFNNWYVGEWRPWYAALHAEAAVVLGHPSARERIELARPMTEVNPTAAAMTERAAALLDGDTDRLVSLAADLAATECRYQWARTLVLAGGDHAAEGRKAMAELGAAPMAEPPFG